MLRADKMIAIPMVVLSVAILSMLLVHRHYNKTEDLPVFADTTVVAKNDFNPEFVGSVDYNNGTYSCMYFDHQMMMEPTPIFMDKYTFRALLGVKTALDECNQYSDEYFEILGCLDFVLWINLGTGVYSLTLSDD